MSKQKHAACMNHRITTFTEYSARCEDVQMDSCRGLDYLDLGLCSETSEITGDLIAKSIRGDFKLADRKAKNALMGNGETVEERKGAPCS